MSWQIEDHRDRVAVRCEVKRTVAAPLFAPDGRRFGIVIANLDLRPVFDRIRWAVRPGSHIYVVNDSGD